MRKFVSICMILILLFSILGIGEFNIRSIREVNLNNINIIIPQNEVHIYRDIYGVPHIYGGSNKAMFFGEGYAQAEDHLEQMLINYLTVQGRMAEIFGKSYLASDKEMRLLRVTNVVTEKYHELSAEAQEAVEAFAQGINYYMETHPEEVPEWATPVKPWEVVVWGKMISLSRPLSRLWSDIRRGINDSEFREENEIYASNEWVVAPEKTADGYAMLQTDPHLPWFGMNSWYEVHLVSDDYNVAGGTMWGVPGVMIGHNDRIAWALTANNPDTADAYIETINPFNPHQYLYDGKWLNMEVVKEKIKVAGSETVEVEFLYTHHGPIVYQKDGLTIAGKMSTWEHIGPLDQVLAYDRAKNLDDFKKALALRQHVRWNHVYGDVDGNIFYIWNARVFHRQGNYDYTRPVDGSTSETEWGELVSLTELPQETNPESKFFQNCNTAPWYVNPLTTIAKGEYPDYVVPTDNFGARGIRATNLLDADWNLTIEEMMEISLDTYSLYAEVLIPLLQYSYQRERNNVSDPNGLLPQAMNVINAWDYRAESDTEEVALGRLWIQKAKKWV